MRVRSVMALMLGTILVFPVLAVGLLSFSGSTGMDFYAQPSMASLKWWGELFLDESWARALVGSLIVATISTSLAMLVAVPAVALWRVREARSLSIGMGLVSLAFFVPGVITAVGLYMMSVEIGLFDSISGLALAHLGVTLPVAIFILRRRLGGSSLTCFLVARSLGASSGRALLTWLSVAHRPTILAATLVSFMTSLSEATITLFLTDTRLVTLPRRVVSGLSQDIEPTGFAAMLLWFALVFLVVFLMSPAEPSHRGDSS